MKYRMLKPIEVVVAEILEYVERERISLRLAMEQYFQANKNLQPIRGIARAFSLAVLRNYRLLDEICAEYLGLRPKNLSLFKRNLLRAIVYETAFREVEYRRVKKCIKYLKIRSNVFTRKIFNEIREADPDRLVKKYTGIERLAVRYSEPTWVVRRLMELLGMDETIKILRSLNSQLPLWLRVNTLKVNPSELCRRLRKHGLDATLDPDLPDVIKISKISVSLKRLPEYRNNLFYIQNKASILVGHVLAPKPCEKILDMCAAPGSKATHLAQLSNFKAHLTAADISYTRLRFLQNYVRCFKVMNVDILVADSRFQIYRGCFDKILVDPDCSSLGLLNHSPEIRLWIDEKFIHVYSSMQRRLLEAALKMIKKNGVITYSTCTFTTEENELIFKEIIEYHDNRVELVEPKPFIGDPGFLGLDKVQRLYPHKHKTIGFTIACFRKL